MKKHLLVLLVLVVNYSYSQSVNDYKAVIIPVKYDFIKTENQYRLNTLTKFNLKKAGFEAFYSNEAVPNDYSDRCSLLYIDVLKENSFLISKLFLTLKDCNGKIIFQSAVGKSKEKEYQVAYTEALNEAFQSVHNLKYKYNGSTTTKVQPATHPEVVKPMASSVSVVKSAVNEHVVANSVVSDSKLLYAQSTANGYQLIDSTPKVIMKVFSTSNKECYIAVKGDIQGVLILKNNQWVFEYYQNDQLWSETIAVKF